MPNRTLKRKITFTGKGIHTGEKSRVTIKPSRSTGIYFISCGITIPATLEYVLSTEHGTDIGKGNVVIRTVEHLMAAFMGTGINSAIVEVDGEEIPIIDGSALPFVEGIMDAGIDDIGGKEKEFIVKRPVSISGENRYAIALPFSGFSIFYVISYPHPELSFQFFNLESLDEFQEEIAPARTFGILSWAEELRKKGLIKGATEDNILLYNENGAVNTPRFSNEVVRHKILDFIGDIGLLSSRIKGFFLVIKGGHGFHIGLAKKLYKEVYGGV